MHNLSCFSCQFFLLPKTVWKFPISSSVKADDLSSVLSNIEEALDPKALRSRYARTLNLVEDEKQEDLGHLRERLLPSPEPASKPHRSQSMRCLGPRPKPSGGLVRPREVPLRRGPSSVSSLESNGSASTANSERSGLLEFLLQVSGWPWRGGLEVKGEERIARVRFAIRPFFFRRLWRVKFSPISPGGKQLFLFKGENIFFRESMTSKILVKDNFAFKTGENRRTIQIQHIRTYVTGSWWN